MFENFSFDNLLQPKNLMAGGGMLAQMGQGMQNGGGLLGAMKGMQGGGGLLAGMQNKELMDLLKQLLAQKGGAMGGMPSGPMGSAPLAPWGGGQY